ncbi:MAG TPA: hypothetical protein VKU00_15560 [Chthonomonadaceae bacterium]|nr:hypothetical protein [Chthonomonadaceae bacterium]
MEESKLEENQEEEAAAKEAARQKDATALAAAAERVLTATFNAPVTLGPPEILRDQYRNGVVRCPVVAGPSGLPGSIVAKIAVGEGEDLYDAEKDTSGCTAWRFYNEWAGNRFLNEMAIEPPLNARLLAGDRTEGLFILEDLGNGDALSDVVQRSDPQAAERALFDYARALGRMHAATIGHADAWRQVRLAIGGTEQEREPLGSGWLKENIAPFLEMCAELEVPVAAGFEEDAETVRQTLDAPGPFEAFSPNDTCPDNHRLMPDGSLRFFDFEFAGYRHALLDASYLQVPFPTCWCVNRIPADLVPRLEEAYRAELARGCPEASDDALFCAAMSHACAFWTFTTLSWQLKDTLKEDGEWGISTVRQRHLYRLETFTERVSRYGHLPAMAETANALSAKLASLWLPELELMPIYPAFRH